MYAINLNPVNIQPGLSNTRDSGHHPYHPHFQSSNERTLYPSPPPSSEGLPTSSSTSHFSLHSVHLDGPDTIRSAPAFGMPQETYQSDINPPFVVPSSDYAPTPTTSKGPDLAARPKKPRREKPRIALAPDQPPTTQGKPRARVYVACLQCRTRKIRCDGAKPVCHNCSRRAGNHECNYDAVPRRRGPDKTPGARQRMARELHNRLDSDGTARRRRRRRDTPPPTKEDQIQFPAITEDHNHALPGLPIPHSSLSPESSDHISSPVDYLSQTHSLPPLNPTSSYTEPCPCHGLHTCPGPTSSTLLYASQKVMNYQSPKYDNPLNFSVSPATSESYITEVDESGNEQRAVDIGAEPSLDFTRKVWWDSLLYLYCAPTSGPLRSLTGVERQTAAENITNDIRFLFKMSHYWFSFFHVPTFFATYHDPVKRERIQPSLILAALALSTFFQSSEAGRSRHGRERALKFRDEAQAALEASLNAGWVDETLAQAAWLLALFEISAHPWHSAERSFSSMVMLDSIIRYLSLTCVDLDDPATSTFQPRTVPTVSEPSSPSPTGWVSPVNPSHSQNELGCSCASLTLGRHWPAAHELVPMWHATPAWNSSWSEAEIRKESCRRICWSAMTMAAGLVSYATIQRSGHPPLWIADPSNYALLFSGESITRSPSLGAHGSSKDNIWALYDRSFLLWHSCARMRNDSSTSDLEKAQFAVKAWLEADAIEAALNRHTCDIERNFIFQGREYIFNTRMCITFEFRRFVPLVPAGMNGLFNRRKAEEWLSHQAIVAQRLMQGMHTVTGNASNVLSRRPFFVFWFMGQVSRALSLWHCDNSMTVALDVCKAFLPSIEYLSNLWPCPEQRNRMEKLRDRLNNACYIAGMPPPAVMNYTSSA